MYNTKVNVSRGLVNKKDEYWFMDCSKCSLLMQSVNKGGTGKQKKGGDEKLLNFLLSFSGHFL